MPVAGRGRVVPGVVVVDGERVVVVEQGVEAGQQRFGGDRQMDVERRTRRTAAQTPSAPKRLAGSAFRPIPPAP
ncbi:MAG: hypothetical protein F4Z60_11925 [Chloroflexi bacterium]|nr:hypothetical protein [Chloroflexota bacterium]